MKHLLLIFAMMLMGMATVMAQRNISGTVTDDTGAPLPFANVYVKGTTIGTTTDIDGNYSLKVPEGSNSLMVSYTGFADQTLDLGDSNTLNFSVSQGVTLDNVVVTALGISRDEKSLGYAVQEVSGEDISNSRETNVVNALQGKVAGIQIQGSPSSIGGSSRITIRGSNSFLGNNQPLFVVDGVPIDNSNFTSSSQMRGFGDADAYDYGNMAQDIDPENVKTMSVLKGAAATALYGQRGSNGVILITTKDGKDQKGFGVEVNSSVGFDQVANLIPHQQQYGGGAINPDTDHGFNEVNIDGTTYLYPAYSKDGAWGPKYDPNRSVRHWDSWDPQASNFGETRPWVAPGAGYEEFFDVGQTFQNSVAVSGASDKGSFRLGYSNTNQTGTFPNAGLQRNGLNFNSNYEMNDRLSVGLSGNYVRTDAQNRNVTGYNNGNPMQAFTQWWQTQLDFDRLEDNAYYTDGSQQTWNSVGPQVDADGNLLFFEAAPNFFDNPYWVRDNYLQEDSRNRFFGNANATLKLTEGLSLSGRVGTDFYDFFARSGIPIASVETASYSETDRGFQETNFEGRLNFNKTFSNFSVTGAVGGNIMRQNRKTLEGSSVGGLSLPGIFNLDNSAGPAEVTTYREDYGINSVFGTVSLGFKNFIYLDLGARNDWSSTLPSDDNSYFYPSASLSAVVTDIPGLDKLGPLSFAKVRLSYASSGSDADPYSLYNVYSPVTPNFPGAPRYQVPNSTNNPLLKPEYTTEYEAGIGLRFFNGRLGFDVAYFDRSTKDQIFPVPTSAATGGTSRVLNAGEMRNWGWEMMLSATPIRTKDFSWDISVNAFRQNNEVVELTEGVESIARGGTWAADLRIAEGLPYMALFGQDFIRENYEEDADGKIITNEGRPTVDEDGNYLFTADRVFLGSAIADWTGGFSTALNYKGLTAGVLFDFQQGGVVHSTSLQWAKYSGMHPETVEYNGQTDIRENGMILNGVTSEGAENTVAVDPQTYYQTYWRIAAPNVYDGSFLKLREVRLGYSLPAGLLGDNIRDVNIGFYGRNLAILSAALPYLDPQIITGAGNDQGLENAQVPSTRSYGVNVRFKF